MPKSECTLAGGARNLHPTYKLPDSAKGLRKIAYYSVSASHGFANELSGRGPCERVGSAGFVALTNFLKKCADLAILSGYLRSA